MVRGRRESATFPTKRDAQAWRDRRKTELRAEAAGRGGDVHTLGEGLLRYAEEVSPTHKGTRWEQVRIKAFLRVLPVALPMTKVGPDHLIAWRDTRLKQVKPSTVIREMNLVSAMFGHAVREWRWIRRNPFSEVSRPRSGKHRERIITWSEVRQILRTLGYRPRDRVATKKQVVAAVFLLALRTGMRSSEIVGLTWDRVRRVFVDLPETKNSDARSVPLSRPSRRLIERMRDLDAERVFPVGNQSRDTLFRDARAAAGLAGFTFHDARHTAATRIGATVGQPGRLSFPEFCKVFGWRDPKHALIYVNPSAESLAAKL